MAPNNYILNGERVSADKYNKAKYEDLRVRVPRGKKEIHGFINEAIDEKMQRDIKKGAE